MALFSRMVRQFQHRNGSNSVVVIERQKPRLPNYFRRLREALCMRHDLPVQMHFRGFGDSHGQRVAVYICPCHGCDNRQAWARHRVTGKPFRLS